MKDVLARPEALHQWVKVVGIHSCVLGMFSVVFSAFLCTFVGHQFFAYLVRVIQAFAGLNNG